MILTIPLPFPSFTTVTLPSSLIRIQRDKVGGVFVAPGGEPYHVALYVPSIKGAHAFVQLYLYGSFEKTGKHDNLILIICCLCGVGSHPCGVTLNTQ